MTRSGKAHRPRNIVLFVLLFLGLPAIACADGGTGLIWVQFHHLTIGNLIIGVGEGLLIGRLFRLPLRSMLPRFILANYFSMIVGLGMLQYTSFRFYQNLSLTQVHIYLWGVFFTTFLLTILLEWPFILTPFRGRPHWVRQSLKASIIAQTASYLILVPIYAYVSVTSVFHQAHLVPSLSFVRNPAAIVYFISAEDGDLYSMRLGENIARREMTLHAQKEDRLFAYPSADGKGSDLYGVLQTEDPFQPRTQLLLPHFANSTRSFGKISNGLSAQTAWSTPMVEPADYRPETERDWEFSGRTYSSKGLWGINRTTGEHLSLALEAPFLFLRMQNLTILPGDELVFQIGKSVCVFDRASRKLGILTAGYGPVVVLPTK